MNKFFTDLLFDWHKEYGRDFPWKKTTDPYKIWLSEIILQQTRVEQGLPYYLAFCKEYPDIHSLANADEDNVMRLWQGLGYYNRARNMLETAKHVSLELDGKFPDTYKDILKLKGIGPYTAAAISSFAYNLPHAVVDGNVIRVISRYFGITDIVDNLETSKLIQKKADQLLARKRAADYNQAIMDFGATFCTPRTPNCETCPFNSKCIAFKKGLIALIPRKTPKAAKSTRYFNYLVLKNENKLLIRKRKGKDIWQNLYEFPYIETSKKIDFEELARSEEGEELIGSNIAKEPSSVSEYLQVLSHQKIIGRFFEFNSIEILDDRKDNLKSVATKNLDNFAFPGIIVRFLKDRSL